MPQKLPPSSLAPVTSLNANIERLNDAAPTKNDYNEPLTPRYKRRASSSFYEDPFNKPELVHTLKGRELCFFVVGFVLAVLLLLVVMEIIRPVFFGNYTEAI